MAKKKRKKGGTKLRIVGSRGAKSTRRSSTRKRYRRTK